MARLSPQMDWALRQAVFGTALAELDRHFEEMGVAYMPIKGAFLICAGLAERLDYRTMVDIDLLVRPTDFTAAAEGLRRRAGAVPRPGHWPFEQEFTYTVGAFPCHLELHRALNYDERFLLPTHELFERARTDTAVRMLPQPEDAMLLLLCHELVHIVRGFDRGHHSEMKLLAGLPRFSWQVFWQRARGTGAEGFVYLSVLYFRRETGTECDLPPWRSRYADALFRLLPLRTYNRLPTLLRRLLLELPFVRDPLGLFGRRFRRSTLSG
jgi:hypothetical protein